MTKKYILGSLNIYLYIILNIIHIIGIYLIDIYSPIEKLFIICISLIISILSYICYTSKKNIIYNSGIILTIIFNITTLYNIDILNNNYDYISNIVTNEYSYKTYNVYVQKKNTKYNNIETLNNKKIGTLNSNSNNICLYITNTINIDCIKYNTLEDIEKAIQEGEIQSFIIEERIYNKIDDNKDIKKQTRSIYQTKIKDTNY